MMCCLETFSVPSCKFTLSQWPSQTLQNFLATWQKCSRNRMFEEFLNYLKISFKMHLTLRRIICKSPVGIRDTNLILFFFFFLDSPFSHRPECTLFTPPPKKKKKKIPKFISPAYFSWILQSSRSCNGYAKFGVEGAGGGLGGGEQGALWPMWKWWIRNCTRSLCFKARLSAEPLRWQQLFSCK